MINQQILDYIKQQAEQGVSNDEIKKSLLSSGWQITDIEEAFNSQQTSNQLPKRSWKKITLITIGIIVLLIIGFLLIPRILNLFTKDIASFDDSDLKLKVVTISDNENAYFDLIKLENVIYEPEGKKEIILDMVAGKTWDDKLAEEIVSQNTEAFIHFTEAARKPKFQDPIWADPANITLDTVLPVSSSWRNMARLSAIKSMYLARQGKDKEAMDEALNSINIGQKIQESQAPLVEYQVAISMKEVGLETVQKILTTSKLSSSELKEYAQSLNKFYKNEDGLINSFKGDYQSITSDILFIDKAIAEANVKILTQVVSEEENVNIDKTKTANNYYFRPNKTKLLFAKISRANIKSVTESCGSIKFVETQKLTPTNFLKIYLEENVIGEVFFDTIGTNFINLSIKKCNEDLLVAATQTLFAIKAYKNDTNSYPSSLKDLIPNYLLTVPQDPFDEKSLKYSTTNNNIYSVGEDTVDSGGSTGDNWQTMPDPTFKINF